MLIKKASTVVHNLNETGLGIARVEEEEEEQYKLDIEEE